MADSILTRADMWKRHAEIGKLDDRDTQKAAYAELHHAYYIQFATDRTRRLVANTIGVDRILASTDPHFNDIPLAQWDALDQRIKDTIDRRKLGAAEDCKPGVFMWSLSTAVSVAKAVAREIKENAGELNK